MAQEGRAHRRGGGGGHRCGGHSGDAHRFGTAATTYTEATLAAKEPEGPCVKATESGNPKE